MNKIHLSEPAQRDLAGIKSYIAEELKNPTAALATITKITKSIRMLKTHAFAGAALSSIARVDTDHRFLVTGNYLCFYRVEGSDVYIDRVIYGKRDYLRVLFDEEV